MIGKTSLMLFAWMITSALLPAAELKVGDVAPKFTAKDDTGADWKSEDHVGKKVVVVYFYPADFTGGCTKQACGFRDDLKILSEQGVEVVGVSGDTAATHAEFKKFHKLNFTLLADEDAKLAEAFGVPHSKGEKTFEFDVGGAGKKTPFTRFATIQRWTFVIGKDGKIAAVETMVKAAEDSQSVLEIVKGLK